MDTSLSSPAAVVPTRGAEPRVGVGRVRRLRVRVEGVVQGVGFRPFVHRTARALGLGGFVANDGQGVVIEVEGRPSNLSRFLARLASDPPPAVKVRRRNAAEVEPVGGTEFLIRASVLSGRKQLSIPPDLATCRACLRELASPSDPRFRYPFINCTQCGPRFSIVQGLPYDRRRTTMERFPMCVRCQAEFSDPGNRRFHAQPNACPDCGPRIAFRDRRGRSLAYDEGALRAAAAAVRRGEVLALKGLGGYQLVVDARRADAVQRLRVRKHRPDKPFAVMMPSRRHVEACCDVSPIEAELLESPQAPIVLLRRLPAALRAGGVTSGVAPGNPWLGVMLPYTPLHHLVMGALGFPVVATSGNRGGEPMVIDEADALERLAGIADSFLTHDRPIARAVDDSVVRVIGGREMVLRAGRGYAPITVPLPGAGAGPVIGLGGHLKVAAATAAGDTAVVGPHIGDLDHELTRGSFAARVAELCELEGTTPRAAACDAHPDYHSTRYASAMGVEMLRVQHHLAHVVACATENGLTGPMLGVAWDGTGYGTDGSSWGGEFLLVHGIEVQRFAHLRSFALPGGERAIVEPRRAALGVLHAAFGARAFAMEVAPVRSFTTAERRVMERMLARGINSPLTTSAGRLFDALAALLGLRQRVSFEGQAAMALEHLQEDLDEGEDLVLPVREPLGGPLAPRIVDWQPLLERVLSDLRTGVAPAAIAAMSHASLAGAIVTVARHAGVPDVVLTGGCFQNRTLAETAIRRLRRAGFAPHWHRRVPPNDGGLALGQVAWARTLLEERPVNVSRGAG